MNGVQQTWEAFRMAAPRGYAAMNPAPKLVPIRVGQAARFQPAVQRLLKQLDSDCSKTLYKFYWARFFQWWDQERCGQPLTKDLILDYKESLRERKLLPNTVNTILSIVRRLVYEATDVFYCATCGHLLLEGVDAGKRTWVHAAGPDHPGQAIPLVPLEVAAAVGRLRGMRATGSNQAHWLTAQEADQVLAAVDRSSLLGLRDGAALALLLGCGLRRSEAAQVRCQQIQRVAGCWAVVDLIGKGNKKRTAQMPPWARKAIEDWMQAAGISEGPLLRWLGKHHRVGNRGISPDLLQKIVLRYAGHLGAAVHDLRRTFARLADAGGAPLQQIKISLGHESVVTTMRYIGGEQNFADPPCNRLGIGQALLSPADSASNAGQPGAGSQQTPDTPQGLPDGQEDGGAGIPAGAAAAAAIPGHAASHHPAGAPAVADRPPAWPARKPPARAVSAEPRAAEALPARRQKGGHS